VGPDPLVDVQDDVRRDMGFDPGMDALAAEFLDAILEVTASKVLKPEDLPVGEDVVVVGAGPSVLRVGEVVDELEGRVVYAADGASGALLEVGVVPDVVVTDLDGGDEVLVAAVEGGAVPVVHAHGDNIEALARLVPVFGEVLGTCQVFPAPGSLWNPGGFTDGDRAVVIAARLGAERVFTVGMDLGDTTTSYSRPGEGEGVFEADPVKRRKLRWAGEVLRLVEEVLGVEVRPLPGLS